MNRFHDQDFDGIVLRIPEWFIEMNNLGPKLTELDQVLQGCRLSMFHPDHKNNLYELANYKNKKKLIQEEKDVFKRKQDEKVAYYKKLMACEFYELEWVNQKSTFDLSNSNFNFRESSFDGTEVFTGKANVKSSFKKWFAENIKTLDDFKQSALLNGNVGIIVDLENCPPEFIDFHDHSMFCSNSGWDQLGIGYKRLYMKLNWALNKSGTGWTYSLARLIQFPDGCLGYCRGNSNIRLEGFQKYGNLKLIKI